MHSTCHIQKKKLYINKNLPVSIIESMVALFRNSVSVSGLKFLPPIPSPSPTHQMVFLLFKYQFSLALISIYADFIHSGFHFYFLNFQNLIMHINLIESQTLMIIIKPFET